MVPAEDNLRTEADEETPVDDKTDAGQPVVDEANTDVG